jgi:hypothetical protein
MKRVVNASKRCWRDYNMRCIFSVNDNHYRMSIKTDCLKHPQHASAPRCWQVSSSDCLDRWHIHGLEVHMHVGTMCSRPARSRCR